MAVTPARNAPQHPVWIVFGLAVTALAVMGLWVTVGYADALWAAWVGIFATFEAHGIFSEAPGDTLSERLHSWFRLKTKAGRLGFFLILGTLFAWLAWHLPTLLTI